MGNACHYHARIENKTYETLKRTKIELIHGKWDKSPAKVVDKLETSPKWHGLSETCVAYGIEAKLDYVIEEHDITLQLKFGVPYNADNYSEGHVEGLRKAKYKLTWTNMPTSGRSHYQTWTLEYA